MDRRALFFLVFAAACGAMVPIAQSDFRWVAIGTAVVYVVLAIASALDHASRSHSRDR